MFFIGFFLSSSLKAQLSLGLAWREKKLALNVDTHDTLITVTIDAYDYLGFYVNHPALSIEEIAEHEDTLRKALKVYCPASDVEKLEIEVIAQLLVS